MVESELKNDPEPKSKAPLASRCNLFSLRLGSVDI